MLPDTRVCPARWAAVLLVSDDQGRGGQCTDSGGHLTPHLDQMQTLRQASEVGTPVSLSRGEGAEGRTRLRCTCPGIMTLETSPGLPPRLPVQWPPSPSLPILPGFSVTHHPGT